MYLDLSINRKYPIDVLMSVGLCFLTHYMSTNKNGVLVFTFKIKRRLADKSQDRKTLDGSP